MEINILSITSKYSRTIHLRTPAKETVYSHLHEIINRNHTYNHTGLPNKIKRKICKEKAIPTFINSNCYVPKRDIKEDPRVYGGVLEYFG